MALTKLQLKLQAMGYTEEEAAKYEKFSKDFLKYKFLNDAKEKFEANFNKYQAKRSEIMKNQLNISETIDKNKDEIRRLSEDKKKNASKIASLEKTNKNLDKKRASMSSSRIDTDRLRDIEHEKFEFANTFGKMNQDLNNESKPLDNIEKVIKDYQRKKKEVESGEKILSEYKKEIDVYKSFFKELGLDTKTYEDVSLSQEANKQVEPEQKQVKPEVKAEPQKVQNNIVNEPDEEIVFSKIPLENQIKNDLNKKQKEVNSVKSNETKTLGELTKEDKAKIYSNMNYVFGNPNYNPPEFTAVEQKDKILFESLLHNRVQTDRYALLPRLVNDIMKGNVKTAAFPKPTMDDIDKICDHVWKVTEMDRFAYNRNKDEYAQYREAVATKENFTMSAYNLVNTQSKLKRSDYKAPYSIGQKARSEKIQKVNERFKDEAAVLQHDIDSLRGLGDNETADQNTIKLNNLLDQNIVNLLGGKTGDEIEADEWNKFFKRSAQSLGYKNIDKEVEINNEIKYFDYKGEITIDKALELVKKGEIIGIADSTLSVVDFHMDKDFTFDQTAVSIDHDYKKRYESMLKDLNEGTSLLNISSKEYSKMRSILSDLSKGKGDEKKNLNDLLTNYEKYAANFQKKVENGKDSSTAIHRKECADKMFGKLKRILVDKNVVDQRKIYEDRIENNIQLEIANVKETPIKVGNVVEINTEKQINSEPSKNTIPENFESLNLENSNDFLDVEPMSNKN